MKIVFNVEKKHLYLFSLLLVIIFVSYVIATGYTGGQSHPTLFTDTIRGKAGDTVVVQDKLTVDTNNFKLGQKTLYTTSDNRLCVNLGGTQVSCNAVSRTCSSTTSYYFERPDSIPTRCETGGCAGWTQECQSTCLSRIACRGDFYSCTQGTNVYYSTSTPGCVDTTSGGQPKSLCTCRCGLSASSAYTEETTTTTTNYDKCVQFA